MKEGVSQQEQTVLSNVTGALNIDGLGSGTYKSITVTPTTGALCLTKGAEYVKLGEPEVPAASTVSGGKDHCAGKPIKVLAAGGSSETLNGSVM